MGSLSQECRKHNMGSVDRRRNEVSYQLARTESSLSIQMFTNGRGNIHVQMYMDNRVAIAYLNIMGGVASQVLCKLAIEIWE
jgi:hypothetical protein